VVSIPLLCFCAKTNGHHRLWMMAATAYPAATSSGGYNDQNDGKQQENRHHVKPYRREIAHADRPGARDEST